MTSVRHVRPRQAVLGTTAIVVAVTAVTALASGYRAAPSEASIAVLDTIAASSALLVAYLVSVRFVYSGFARDALMAFALLLLAAGNLVFSVLPTGIDRPVNLTGAPVLIGMAAAACFVTASCDSDQ